MNSKDNTESRIDTRLEIAAYKAVHGSDCLKENINSKEFMDECFRESPWCESIIELMDEDYKPTINFESVIEGMTSELHDD
jgi:hypothetical protein